MKNKYGFTLIELLAVIVVLAIILAIAIPTVSNIVRASAKNAFESNAKMVIQAIEYKRLENESFNPLEVTKENMQETIGINSDNYKQVNVTFETNKTHILLVGNGPWNGFVAYGTKTSMNVVNVEDYDVIPPSITINGDNPAEIGQGETYVDAGATATDLIDGDVPLTSTVIKNASDVVVDHIDTTSLGTYTITYTSSDKNGNTTSAVRRVNVVDRIPPVITLIGSSTVSMSLGGVYVDAGATATDNIDGDVTSNIVVTGKVYPELVGSYEIIYDVKDSFDNAATPVTRTVNVTSSAVTFNYTGATQTFTAPQTSTYKIELWGAQGGSAGGKGGYVSGEIDLNQNDVLSIYVGGTTTTSAAGYNGGGQGNSAQGSYGFGGGGGTDVRIGGTTDKDRIIVAGAGGGNSLWNTYLGGASGGLTGLPGTGVSTYYGSGGTQAAGGAAGTGAVAGSPGIFFAGGKSVFAGGAGGGGYYGGGGAGYANNSNPNGGGGGGSSFISGYTGCNAIDATGTPTGQPNHFSGYIFKNGQMIAGNASMPTTTTGTEVGHAGNGYAKITRIGAANERPTISINGSSSINLYQGVSYNDAGATAIDNEDGDITNKIVSTSTVNTSLPGTYEVTYSVRDSEGITVTAKRVVKVYASLTNYAYTGGGQTFRALMNGTYKIELWGAQGGNSGGKGGYVVGEIALNQDVVLNIYVGGTTTTSAAGYNGGGQGNSAQGSYGFGGGGGTDVRIGGTTDKDRIIVAGAGGGNSLWNTYLGGAGGGLTGLSGTGISTYYGSGGTQTAGGAAGTGAVAGSPGIFFAGGKSVFAGGAGGGGYYGGGGAGYANNSNPNGGGGGGSSFISGYTGCNAIDATGTPTGQPNHFSGYIFKNGQMIAGNASMPTTTTGTEVGHVGNGYAKVTYIGP